MHRKARNEFLADVVLRWCTDVLVVNDIEPLFGQNDAMQSWSFIGQDNQLGWMAPPVGDVRGGGFR